MSVRAADLVRILRPQQWVKNAFCMAGLVFGDRLGEPHSVALAVATSAVFCAVSSGVYVFNDVADRQRDALHPAKSARPLASGAIPVGAAVTLGVLLLAAGTLGAWLTDWRVLACVALYLANNLLYTLWLKREVLLDVISIAAGFCLRVLAGIFVFGDVPTTWILMCTFFLAVFLGAAKRYGELSAGGEGGNPQRPVLNRYSHAFLDHTINGAATMTIVSYALFCAISHKNPSLILTLPFVYYGVMTCKREVFARQAGEEVELLLMRNPRILATVLLWLASFMAIQYSGLSLFR